MLWNFENGNWLTMTLATSRTSYNVSMSGDISERPILSFVIRFLPELRNFWKSMYFGTYLTLSSKLLTHCVTNLRVRSYRAADTYIHIFAPFFEKTWRFKSFPCTIKRTIKLIVFFFKVSRMTIHVIYLNP